MGNLKEIKTVLGSKEIPKTDLQKAFEASKFNDSEVDLSRYIANGNYIFTSAKDAFEMFMHKTTRDENRRLQKLIAHLIEENIEELKRCAEKNGGIYIDKYKSTSLTIDGPPYITICSLDFVTKEYESLLEIRVSEYLQQELYVWTKNELKNMGIKTYMTHQEWLENYKDKN